MTNVKTPPPPDALAQRHLLAADAGEQVVGEQDLLRGFALARLAFGLGVEHDLHKAGRGNAALFLSARHLSPVELRGRVASPSGQGYSDAAVRKQCRFTRGNVVRRRTIVVLEHCRCVDSGRVCVREMTTTTPSRPTKKPPKRRPGRRPRPRRTPRRRSPGLRPASPTTRSRSASTTSTRRR